MSYLDFERLAAVDADEFQNKQPFPWANPVGLLHDDAFERLVETVPPLELFEKSFDKYRKFAQKTHDRYNLEYRPEIPLAEPWRDFIEELKGDDYRSFLERIYGRGAFKLRFHWHFAPIGCSVSPHCDSAQKLGSHLFYLNPSRDWDPTWGGATVALDDGGRFHRSSGPAFGDFDSAVQSQFVGNASFIFRRTAHSWHGVEEIRCPEGSMRRIFIVVVDLWGPIERIPTLVLRRGVVRF